MRLDQGVFTISLDFELYWGLRDKKSIEQYQLNLLGVRKAVPEMLRVFNENNIHCTWATVGFLFFNDVDELKKHTPALLPTYAHENYSPYEYIKRHTTLDSNYHFAPELIDSILAHNGQEVGTHTFSHYYCLEDGQTLAQFEADLLSAINVAKSKGIVIQSLVFPRNQWNAEYLSLLTKLNIQCFRGNETNWMYDASENSGQNNFRRALRLLDAYINLSGHNVSDLNVCIQEKPYNFPSSRFLRPYSPEIAFMDPLKLKRIKDSMTHAAINKQIFHLWWHPHNFGINLKENILFLLKIINHFKTLKEKYGMASLNMGEICSLSERSHGK